MPNYRPIDWEKMMQHKATRTAHAKVLTYLGRVIRAWPPGPERDALYSELIAPELTQRLMRIAALGLDLSDLSPAEAASKILVATIKKCC